jgi:hypothetical protein
MKASLPDTSTHVNRFEIKSQTSDRVYTIAQSKTGRWWSCSCNGWLRHKSCKHLKALGLPGQHQPFEPRRSDAVAKKTFAEIDAARKRYDPTADGYGETKEWVAKFGERMGYEEAVSVIRATSETPRKILGLGAYTTWDEVRAVYRVLIRNSHPDRCAETGLTMEQAIETCRKINAAYAVLARELGK